MIKRGVICEDKGCSLVRAETLPAECTPEPYVKSGFTPSARPGTRRKSVKQRLPSGCAKRAKIIKIKNEGKYKLHVNIPLAREIEVQLVDQHISEDSKQLTSQESSQTHT